MFKLSKFTSRIQLPKGTVPSVLLPKGTVPSFLLPKGTVPSFLLPKGTVPSFQIPKETVPSFQIPKETVPIIKRLVFLYPGKMIKFCNVFLASVALNFTKENKGY